MTQITLAAAMPFLNWSRLWQLELPSEEASRVWRALGLGEHYTREHSDYQRFFSEQISMDASGGVEVDMAELNHELKRVCDALELSWDGVDLPRHHVSALCEILAYALEREEPEIAAALAADYLMPWCESVEQRILARQPDLAFLTEDFAQDLLLVLGSVEASPAMD